MLTTSNSLLPVRDTTNLKILLASTPKTGNTWTRQLLATAYNLPKKDLTVETFKYEELKTLGQQWVSQCHYDPQPLLRDWLKQNKVVLVTTIRHPCDTLVSLYHFVVGNPAMPYYAPIADELVSKSRDGEGPLSGEFSDTFWQFFQHELEISLNWLRLGHTQLVRYEDLWRDPLATFASLTASIREISQDIIERTVESADFKLLRSQFGANTQLLRRGGIGGWVAELGPDIIEVLNTRQPFPSLMAELGYNLDPNDPILTAPLKPRPVYNPFRTVSHFDNGVPIAPIIPALYLTLPTSQTQQWQPVEKTAGSDTFWHWLNAPTPLDPSAPDLDRLLISNLMVYIYQTRPPIQETFPDIYGQDRRSFVEWFLRWGADDYHLDEGFKQAIQASRLRWWVLSGEEDEKATQPTISNYALHLYQLRPDVREAFSDLFGQHRVAFVEWVLRQEVPTEEQTAQQALRNQFVIWANSLAPDDPYPDQQPRVTAYAVYLYRSRPDVQAAFPDLFGQHRQAFSRWLLDYGRIEHQIDPVLLEHQKAQ